LSEINAQLYSTLQETFTGIRMIKTFGLEAYVNHQFQNRSEQYANFLIKTSLVEEVSHPMVELITAFALAPIVYYGSLQVLVGKMTTGDLFAFFTAFALMINPIRMMNDINIKVNQAIAATHRIFEVFLWKPHLSEAEHPKRIHTLCQEIQLKNVSFAYPDTPGRLVLKNINLTIPRGQTVAIIGASGAGKSSLINLLPRIFDVTSGSIQVDGEDLRELALEDLRRMISVVSQDVFLFNDTVEENIRCGKLNASFQEIFEAAKRAHALDFIQKMPQQFQSIIGDRGEKLSGGERQRLSIARAFLREAPVLILDEATSSLDHASERAVQNSLDAAIDELMHNRTTLIIAHRLSTIRNADQIVVLKEGQIVEKGYHDELIGLGGEYARFHEMSH
jgi:subfamily B ATP-binding cassette protein MsbA